MSGDWTEATAGESWTAAVLGWGLVAGLYADGWAHVNEPNLETFFTPWHGVLYGSFALLVASLAVMGFRRRAERLPWPEWAPAGYRLGWTGVAVFAVGGLADMAWHLAFGIEAGLDALVSPTHLILLAGGLLLVLSPFRAQPRQIQVWAWPAVLSLAAATALIGFFLSYLSVFAGPAATEPLLSIPEGAPGHRAAELPAITGLGGYLVTTLLLVGPLLHLHRRARIPFGTPTLLVAAVAVPAAMLSSLEFLTPAATAVASAVLIDLLLRWRPDLSDTAVAALLPLLVWSAQLVGLASSGRLAWPPELWAGVVVLSALLAAVLARLLQPHVVFDIHVPH